MTADMKANAIEPYILITGGAGYIGSHIAKMLYDNGYSRLIILDNLSTGKAAVPKLIGDIRCFTGDISDRNLLDGIFSSFSVNHVIHCAGRLGIEASIKNPNLFYQCNVLGSINLLNAMIDNGVCNMIFSSSGAVYGNDSIRPFNEKDAVHPMSPYGRSKHMVEQVLQDLFHAGTINFIALRYFNVTGYQKGNVLSTHFFDKNNVVPKLIQLAVNGGTFKIFGNEYPTKDGTCIRDYIAVDDIARAHLKALEFFKDNKCVGEIINLGSGREVSVQDIVQAIRDELKINVSAEIGRRRDGDVPYLLSNVDKSKRLLRWQAEQSIHQIVRDAYEFLTGLERLSYGR